MPNPVDGSGWSVSVNISGITGACDCVNATYSGELTEGGAGAGTSGPGATWSPDEFCGFETLSSIRFCCNIISDPPAWAEAGKRYCQVSIDIADACYGRYTYNPDTTIFENTTIGGADACPGTDPECSLADVTVEVTFIPPGP